MALLPGRVCFFMSLASSAAGVRVLKRRSNHADTHPVDNAEITKTIAGVPVLNYDLAYGGDSVGKAGAEEEWVVVVKAGVSDSEILKMCKAATRGCTLMGSPSSGGVPFFEFRGTEIDLEAVIESGNAAVEFVEPDQPVEAIPELPADEAPSLWSLERVGASKRTNEGAGVTVFVMDTGVRTTHADFAGGRAISTLDATVSHTTLQECNGDISCARDFNGHGTHCAGSAAGAAYGIAPAAMIRAVKVLNDQGGGSFSSCTAALDWISKGDIRPALASMSIRAKGRLYSTQIAINQATQAGIVVIVAAGNSNDNACYYSPAFVESAITVGSTTSQERRSKFSNYGRCVEIWAPGSDIVSADHESDDGTRTLSGTSMACPHVAGGAALVLEKNPQFTRDQVLEVLLANARRDSVEFLRKADDNAELYIGSDAPPPKGTVPPVQPAICPSQTTTGPDSDLDCKCKTAFQCYRGGVRGACPILWGSGTSTRYYNAPACVDCICK